MNKDKSTIESVKKDILSISDVVNAALIYGESIDLYSLNDKLHQMYLKLDSKGVDNIE